jgi:hypothetical protein
MKIFFGILLTLFVLGWIQIFQQIPNTQDSALQAFLIAFCFFASTVFAIGTGLFVMGIEL